MTQLATLQPRLVLCDRWRAASFRGLGIPEAAQVYDVALTRLLKAQDHGAPHPKPGLMLLRITATDRASRTPAKALSLQMTRQVPTFHGREAILGDDIVTLRNEYDALVGLKHVKGTTWQHAPALFLSRILTGRLTSTAGGYRLVLELRDPTDPSFLRQTVTTLGCDPHSSDRALHTAVAALLAQTAAPAHPRRAKTVLPDDPALRDSKPRKSKGIYNLIPVWAHPSKFVGSGGRFSACPSPETSWYGSQQLNSALKIWFDRIVPRHSAMKPWADMLRAQVYLESPAMRPPYPWLLSTDRRHQQDIPAYIDAMKKLAKRYSDHPAGLAARFKLLVLTLKPGHEREELATVDDILSRLKPRARDAAIGLNYDTRQVMLATRALIAAAMGHPLHWSRGQMWRPVCLVFCGGWSCSAGRIGLVKPTNAAQAKADLAVMAAQLRHGQILPRHFRRIVEDAPPGKGVRAHELVNFARPILHYWFYKLLDFKAKALDYLWIYQQSADFWIKQLNRPKPRYSAYEIASHFPSVKTNRAFPDLYLYQPIHDRLTAAVVAAIAAGKFADKSAGHLDYLRSRAGVAHHGDDSDYLAHRAREGWQTPSKFNAYWCQLTASNPKGLTNRQMAEKWFRPYLETFKRTARQHPDMPHLFRLTYYFAMHLVMGGYYDQARPLLEKVVDWSSKINDDDASLHDNHALVYDAGFLLAVCYQHDGNVPAARRLAARTLHKIGDRNIPFFTSLRVGGGEGWYDFAGVQTRLTQLIQRLRHQPNAPVVNPFDQSP